MKTHLTIVTWCQPTMSTPPHTTTPSTPSHMKTPRNTVTAYLLTTSRTTSPNPSTMTIPPQTLSTTTTPLPNPSTMTIRRLKNLKNLNPSTMRVPLSTMTT